MIPFSLKLRTFFATLIGLVIFVPLMALALEKAFVSSLTQSLFEQLRTHSLTLISEFEFDNRQPVMPISLHNQKLNIPESGLYALVKVGGKFVWLSESSLAENVIPLPKAPESGQEMFQTVHHGNLTYYTYTYTVEFQNVDNYVPVTFILIQSSAGFDSQVSEFRATLWYWLVAISIVLMLVLLISWYTALLPLRRLIEQIKQIEKGNIHKIESVYPIELEQLKSNINHLLEAEQTQRQRYKNSLSDLAHSIKTPLAVLLGQRTLPEDTQLPLLQIQQIVERQLKRASANAESSWLIPEPLLPLIKQIFDAMSKIHKEKALHLEVQCEASHTIKIDKTDAIELLANLIDNACKAAQHRVQVLVEQTPDKLAIKIEDDGSGIPEEKRDAIINRGARLDSYSQGQGIGLALVSDLLSAYGGQMQIASSMLGGAAFTITFEGGDSDRTALHHD